jgi:endonuclease-3 related protein
MLCPHRILEADSAHLAELVRASGYFNAKARKLKALAAFWPTQDGVPPSRRELLAVWGIGPETADSILLYAFHVPELVVDTYTRRIVAAHWPAADLTGYEGLKRFCAAGLPRSVAVYQEFHALIVEHAQRHYRRNAPPDPLAHEPSAQRP